MSRIAHPSSLRRRDYLVAAVDSQAVDGVHRPRSLGFMAIERCQIIGKLFTTIAWPRGACPVTMLQTLAEIAASSSSPVEDRLFQVADPTRALRLGYNLLNTAAKRDLPVVTHTAWPGLEALLAALPRELGKEAPEVSVISTAVLERARQAGVRQQPGERDADFYLRAAALEGPLPDLRACLDQRGISMAPLLPGDLSFPAFTVHRLFLEHLIEAKQRKA
jgi:hypothetical protein